MFLCTYIFHSNQHVTKGEIYSGSVQINTGCFYEKNNITLHLLFAKKTSNFQACITDQTDRKHVDAAVNPNSSGPTS